MPFAIPVLIGLISGCVGIVLGRSSANTPPPAAAAAPTTTVTPPGPTGSTGGSGQAAAAADADAERLRKAHAALADVDKRLEALEKSTADANADVAKELDSVKADLDAKATELGDRLKTPEGLKEFRDFYIQRLEKAKSTLQAATDDAHNKARDARGVIEDYKKLAGDTGGDDGGSGHGGGSGGGDHGGDNGGSGSGGGDHGGGSDQGAPPPAGTQPAAATPQPAPAAGMPLAMPGGGMPLGGVPGLGGIPGLGGGVPGLGDAGAAMGTHPAGLSDADTAQQPAGDHADLKPGDTQHGSGATTAASATGADGGEDQGGGTDHSHAAPAGNTSNPDLSVELPDGTKVDAPNHAAMAAVRSAVGGTPVDAAWQQAGVTLPPAGTPVLDPIPPGDLKAGDVGYFKDHLVMALGNSKFLVNGQVQPESSLSTGDDFLGWMRPGTSTGAGGQQPATS